MLTCGCYNSNASSNPTNNKSVEKEKPIVVATKSSTSLTKPKVFGYGNGDFYLNKYMQEVRQILLIEQSKTEQSVGKLCLLSKTSDSHWLEVMQCKAYLGKNGIDKSREGDKRTPTGDYGMVMAFGAKDDPGSLVSYTKLTNTMYLCGDKEYYNQFIDVSKINHTCSKNSEHLIRYVPQYNYALFFDYNKENIFGKGSAIFFIASNFLFIKIDNFLPFMFKDSSKFI